MTYKNDIIYGKHCVLRPVNEEDSEFIVSIRNQSRLSRYISKSAESIEDQRQWIIEYLKRRKIGTEYYFIACDLHGNPCGTVRIYNIKEHECTGGSWVMSPITPIEVSLESYLLPLAFAFKTLSKSVLHIDVRQENTRVWKWHELCGAIYISENKLERFYDYIPARYSIAENRVQKSI